jgi:hypothetical protein
MINATTAGRWFKRVMWLGVFANLALALPTIAAPDMMIQMIGFPTATPVMWPRFAGLLLVILSVFYMPAAVDPDRYRVNAWFAIGSRAAGVAFFIFDFVFLVPEALLLIVAIQTAPGVLGTSAGVHA